MKRIVSSERVSMVDLKFFIEKLIDKANKHVLTEKDALLIEEGIKEGIAEAISETESIYRKRAVDKLRKLLANKDFDEKVIEELCIEYDGLWQ